GGSSLVSGNLERRNLDLLNIRVNGQVIIRPDSHSKIGLKREGHRFGDALRPLRLAIGKLNHIGFTKSKTETTGSFRQKHLPGTGLCAVSAVMKPKISFRVHDL